MNKSLKNKALIVLPNNKLGGAEQVLLMLVEGLAKKNYDIDVFFLKYFTDGGWNDIANVTYIIVDQKSEKRGFLKFFLKMIFIRKQYTLAITSHVACTSLVGILNYFHCLKIKKVVCRESTSIFKRFTGLKKKSYEFLYWIGYKKVDLLICQTKFMKDQLVENLPYLESRTHIKVMDNPINIQMIAKCSLDTITTFDQNQKENKIIVTAGRLIQEKGFDILIKSVKLLIETYNPNICLYILGEGPERAKLEAQIIASNLSDNVFLLGFQSNVYPFFRKADLCIVSSRIEGFPNVLLQMMSQNVNVISTNCAGGITEIPGIIVATETTDISIFNALKRSLSQCSLSNRILFDEYLNKRDSTIYLNNILHEVNL
ncbi:glycosyltransferase [Flavobacterium sp. 14A]|uniref:glycosyltransferase n=1 Tax=Flavobacterium sp. 14A TaxID=2735896 RepID=UPI00156EC501|nr:glycosyltransferase [Flavobacterium sp. 14A]NRT10966.1 glycosyltransferase involved in cell wall biosynthesis [Flavobacterium sp. 14A]